MDLTPRRTPLSARRPGVTEGDRHRMALRADGPAFVRAPITYGRLAKKRGLIRMVNVRCFPETFTQMSLARQKLAFGEDLMEMLTRLGERLKRKKANYDIAGLMADVREIIGAW